MEAVTVREIEAAAETIDGVARRTPVLEAGEISRRVGTPVTLKAECLQATGSFKVRGAFNAIAALGEAELQSGVVTASAGNHAQAVVAAAKRAGARADLFMPAAAPIAKVAAVRRRGGEVHLVEGSYDEAAEAAREFAGNHGATFVPAFDHPAIVAGQGTIGLEIAEQAPETTLGGGPGGRRSAGRRDRDRDQGPARGLPRRRRPGRELRAVPGVARGPAGRSAPAPPARSATGSRSSARAT